MKEYTKPALLVDQQINLLETRGLIFDDPNFAREFFARASYYKMITSNQVRNFIWIRVCQEIRADHLPNLRRVMEYGKDLYTEQA